MDAKMAPLSENEFRRAVWLFNADPDQDSASDRDQPTDAQMERQMWGGDRAERLADQALVSELSVFAQY